MCILFIAKNQHPDYPLIIAANRDEYFERPTRSARFWSSDPDVLAGKDLKGGGSWFGINRQGRIAAITNLRAPELVRADAMSRGGLVCRYLRNSERTLDFQNYLETSADAYNPFNMLFGDPLKLQIFNSITQKSTPLSDGIFSVSNGFPEDNWPKMARGSRLVEAFIASSTSIDATQLAAVLRDEQEATANTLPDTGIPQSVEKALSPIFIKPKSMPGGLYGTRSTTVLLCRPDRFDFYEFNHQANASEGMHTHYLVRPEKVYSRE